MRSKKSEYATKYVFQERGVTLGLRALVGGPRYRCTIYFPRFFWDRHPF